MLNKRVLLATSALAVLAGVGQAQAGTDIYVSVFGGANLMPSNSGHFSNNFDSTSYRVDPDTGFLIGGAVGTHLDRWLHGLRVELEASYRRNDVGGSWTTAILSRETGGPIDANISTFAVMANVWYDINIGTKWVPYVGGGAGWARTHVDGVFVVTTSDGGENGNFHRPFDFDRSGFAWQLGAGLNYPIQDGVNLGIGYRFFRGPSIKNDVFLGKNHLPVNFENDNHSVLLSLTIDTN